MTEQAPRSAAATDPGQRALNEDAFLLDDRLGLYLVADGVGGREAGDVASRVACDTIRAQIDEGVDLAAAIGAAHTAIRNRAQSASAARSMAATVVALRVEGGGYRVAWSGDSRCYRWDGRRLLGLTRDHSSVEAMVLRGELLREETRHHPRRHVITSALGGGAEAPKIGENGGSVASPTLFLLCSDGLTDVLRHDAICEVLRGEADLQQRADRLAALAREAPGRDNITVVLVALEPGAGEGDEGMLYESYDADSGDHRWPGDQKAASAPTVRRVPGRSAHGAPATEHGPPRRSGAQGSGRAPWRYALGAGLLIVAAALMAYAALS